MALSPGTRLGPCEITAQIGVGGLGKTRRTMRSAALLLLAVQEGGQSRRTGFRLTSTLLIVPIGYHGALLAMARI